MAWSSASTAQWTCGGSRRSRATQQFERRYKGRTAVERVNGRTKVFWGADDGNLRGSRRFHAHLGVIMIVCVGFATLLAMTKRREGSMGDTRLSPIALALSQVALDSEAVQTDNPAVGAGVAVGSPEATPTQGPTPLPQPDTS